MFWAHFFLVMLGGGLGAGCRHLIGFATLNLLGSRYPWSILLVNIFGGFLMGGLIGSLSRWGEGSLPLLTATGWRLFLGTGFLGGFTTFSAFSLDVVLLFERSSFLSAVLYAAISVQGSVLALLCGLWMVRSLAPLPPGL